MKRKINVFLLGIPVVLYLKYFAHQDAGNAATIIFVLSALSLLPLAAFVESAVEELAELLGQFIGGLLHTTFGNLAELAIGVLILISHVSNGEEIVRASIAGSVIRNSLLFLGVATVMGCIRNGKMAFDSENASQYSTVFALAVIGIALPTVLSQLHLPGFEETQALRLSMALAGVLLVSYLAYILFAIFRVAEGRDLVAHRQRKRQERAHQQRTRRHDIELPAPAQPDVNALFQEERARAEERLAFEATAATSHAAEVIAPQPERRRIDPRGMRLEAKREEREERGEAESGLFADHPILRGLVATLVLAISATGVVVMSESFVGTIEPITTAFFGGNEFFIGLIIIPVIGGMVELTGAVGMARRNRMEITMAVTAGASIQVILLVAPVLVIVGALVGSPFTLVFQPIALAVFIASAFVFMLLGRDGESTWLEGVQLIAVWVLTAATAFFLRG